VASVPSTITEPAPPRLAAADAHGTRRRLPWLAPLLVLSTAGTICRPTTNSGVSSGADVAVSSNGNGTFVGRDSSGASVRATISDALVYLNAATSADAGPSSFLAVAQLGGDNGTEVLLFSSPAGVATAALDANIALGPAPLPGTYTAQSVGVSGSVGLAYTTASGAEAFAASASAGSWTLSLTSVEGPDGGTGPLLYELVHGTLAADLVDGQGGSGTLQIAF
jgi:hypothetical protein